MLLYTPPKPADSIPVIDLSASFAGGQDALRDTAQAIHRACRETGFFYVAGHGVPSSLIAGQFAAAKAFFALPPDQKLALHMSHSRTTSGYEPMGGQVLDSQDASSEKAPPDVKESFYCGLELSEGDSRLSPPVRGLGHNQWPNLPGFKAQTTAYHAALTALGDHILKLLALSLDMPGDWFVPAFNGTGGMLRFIHYPPQPENAAFNQIGAGAHTDWGGITLLAQDDCGGLEVRNVEGDWLVATPIEGTFVINLGDLMMRWTNGVYRSNFHRVNNNVSGRDRYSLPFFYSPRNDALITPVPSCVTPDHPRQFPDCTCAEHMGEMFRRSYGYSPAA